MTREQAIITLKVVDENATCDDCLYYNQMEDCPNDEDCIIRQALDMAIKALLALDKTDEMKQEIRLRLGLLDCIPDIMAIIDKYKAESEEV